MIICGIIHNDQNLLILPSGDCFCFHNWCRKGLKALCQTLLVIFSGIFIPSHIYYILYYFWMSCFGRQARVWRGWVSSWRRQWQPWQRCERKPGSKGSSFDGPSRTPTSSLMPWDMRKNSTPQCTTRYHSTWLYSKFSNTYRPLIMSLWWTLFNFYKVYSIGVFILLNTTIMGTGAYIKVGTFWGRKSVLCFSRDDRPIS